MRTAQQYALGAEKAMDRCESAQADGNPDAARMHLVAAQILSNLAIAAAQNALNEFNATNTQLSDRNPRDHLSQE